MNLKIYHDFEIQTSRFQQLPELKYFNISTSYFPLMFSATVFGTSNPIYFLLESISSTNSCLSSILKHAAYASDFSNWHSESNLNKKDPSKNSGHPDCWRGNDIELALWKTHVQYTYYSKSLHLEARLYLTYIQRLKDMIYMILYRKNISLHLTNLLPIAYKGYPNMAIYSWSISMNPSLLVRCRSWRPSGKQLAKRWGILHFVCALNQRPQNLRNRAK